MTILLGETTPNPPSGLGSMVSVTTPSAGQDWAVAVPASTAWRIWGGGCQFHASSTVATRVPALLISNGPTFLYVYYNTQGGGSIGVTANATAEICYYEQSALLPTRFVSEASLPVGLRAIWLPAGTTITGHFDNIQSGDQASQIALLVEAVAV